MDRAPSHMRLGNRRPWVSCSSNWDTWLWSNGSTVNIATFIISGRAEVRILRKANFFSS